MVDAGGEVDFRWLEGVVCGKVDCEEEDAAGVWGVAGAHDRRLPVELCGRSGQYVCFVTFEAYRLSSQAGAWAEHTRSSPIGPALHDDGGSLWYGQYTIHFMCKLEKSTYRPRSVSS